MITKFTKKSNSVFGRGFTLLEALVAISILMVAVAAPMTIVQKGLASAVFTKNQMIASYLVQDAMEFIINQRDVSAKKDLNWESFITEYKDCVGENALCVVDTVNKSLDSTYVASYGNQKLKKITDGGGNFRFYGYNSGVETNFIRTVNIIRVDQKATITVKVAWGPDDDEKVEISTLIYNR